MMKKMIYPTLLLALIIAGCSTIQEPEFKRIDQFKIKGLGFSDASVGFKVTYYNPNNFSMTVKETEAQLSLDGVDMGKFSQDSLVSVGARTEFSIPISGKIPFEKALQLNPQNLSGDREVQIKAVGSTKVGKAGIFVTKPFTYESKHRLDQMGM